MKTWESVALVITGLLVVSLLAVVTVKSYEPRSVKKVYRLDKNGVVVDGKMCRYFKVEFTNNWGFGETLEEGKECE